jgi:hypothetical protein
LRCASGAVLDRAALLIGGQEATTMIAELRSNLDAYRARLDELRGFL